MTRVTLFFLAADNILNVPVALFSIYSSGFSIDWLKISGPSLALTAAGYISKDPNQILRLNVRGLDLDFLNYFQESRKAFIQGNLEGNIIATELLTNPRFEADIEVDSLQLNQVHMGRLDLRSDYSYDDSKINIDALLKLGELEMLNANGFYDSQGIGNIDLTFKFNRFYLAALDPFAAPVAENLRGQASGTVTMKGPARKPDIKGEFLLPKAGLTISFLQTDYNLVGQPKLLLDNESIRFPNLKLVDANHNVGYLNGEVRHRAFKDFYIDFIQTGYSEIRDLDIYHDTVYVTTDLGIYASNFKKDIMKLSDSWESIYLADSLQQFIPESRMIISNKSFIHFIND